MISSTKIFLGAREKFKHFSKRLKTRGSKEKAKEIDNSITRKGKKIGTNIIIQT